MYFQKIFGFDKYPYLIHRKGNFKITRVDEWIDIPTLSYLFLREIVTYIINYFIFIVLNSLHM